tara:strand:+ start:545 stop:790 length:246 start_codon:yes stop_codon:yes gene_type:complete
MSIDNQIFNHYREQQARIEESIKLLEEHGYIVQKAEETRPIYRTKYIKQEIKRLKSKLVGNLKADTQTQKEIDIMESLLCI